MACCVNAAAPVPTPVAGLWGLLGAPVGLCTGSGVLAAAPPAAEHHCLLLKSTAGSAAPSDRLPLRSPCPPGCLQASAFSVLIDSAHQAMQDAPQQPLEPFRQWLLKVGRGRVAGLNGGAGDFVCRQCSDSGGDGLGTGQWMRCRRRLPPRRLHAIAPFLRCWSRCWSLHHSHGPSLPARSSTPACRCP